MTGTLEQLAVKAGVKAVLRFGRTEDTLLGLGMRVGATAIVILADDEPCTGQRAPVEIPPDDPELPLGLGA